MTPDEAVVKFVELRIVAAGDDYTRSAVLDVLRAIASTAENNETRRCAALMEDVYDSRYLANRILITGGLKVEDEGSP